MRTKILFVLLVSLACTPTCGWAQTAATASLSGEVTDKTGAVIPNAEVSLIDTTTNVTLSTKTNEAGHYGFVNVKPGDYKLTASAQGFRQAVVSHLEVSVAKSYTVNLQLEVGTLTQTVEVAVGLGAELQTTDATVGNELRGEQLRRLPTSNRSAVALLTLQPLVMPYRHGRDNDNTGGQVAGARTDQSTFLLDGADITDNTVGTHPVKPTEIGVEPAVPVPIESIEEFRVGTTNPNATFGRSSGGQVAFVTRRGTNSLHGSAYWYHQNDALNANSWDLNRTGQKKPPLRDNRFGGSAGGPIWKDRTFVFGHYEGRRLPRSGTITRLVPTDTLRRGILRFRDASGVVRDYPLATSTACGTAGGQACDPRSLGLSPTISDLWDLLPPGNDPALGDGLNTIGFRSTVGIPSRSDFGVLRLDHAITQKWQFMSTYRYFTGETASATQTDIGGLVSGNTLGKPASTATVPVQPRYFVAGLTGQISSRLTNEFRFAYLRDWWWLARVSPFPQVASTNVALQVTGNSAFSGLVDEPIDVHTQLARTQGVNSKNFQFVDNATWQKARHTLQFGGTIRQIVLFHLRDDKVVGSLASILAEIDDQTAVTIPANNRPRDCATGITTNCLVSGDVTRWNRLFAGVTGMIDNVGVMLVRDGSLNNLPLGTPLTMDTTNQAYDIYFNDTWRIRNNLTVTLGLTYQWQTPPVEKFSRNTFMVDSATGEILTSKIYLQRRREAALRGEIYNPSLGFQPLESSSRDRIMDIDWSNIGPRLAVAWTPTPKTVIRGGYSIVYDRLNTVQTVVIPLLGVGFAQTINCRGPRFNVPGGGNPCQNTNDPSNAWRIGVDGPAPVPAIPPQATPPVVPSTPFGELLSFQMDPDIKIGRSHSLDFTIQRELPWNMLLEVGYVGRMGRRLNQNKQLTSVPFFMRDKASFTSFAEAFDFVAEQIRAGTTPFLAGGAPNPAFLTHPWFENQIGPGGTRAIANGESASFRDGLVSQLWTTLQFRRLGAGLPPISNLQVLDLWMRTDGGRSNYNALLVTLNKRTSHGLALTVNYTLSKAMDQAGLIQNFIGTFSSSYDPDIDYGPAFFDRRHVLTSFWTYELPFGRGRRFASSSGVLDKFIGGWFTSGIFTFNTGLPLTVRQSLQVWGGDPLDFSVDAGAIPTQGTDFGHSVRSGVAGSGGVGTSGDPAKKGSGLNLFADPKAVFDSFRKIRISEDTRSARGVLRGQNRWNVDLSVGKLTRVTESVGVRFSFDFLNAFNHLDLSDPLLRLQDPASFGVLTQQFNNPRAIQFGLRVEF